ncbi:MAG: hypothetical protein BZ135_09110 [Methanosphaera sp. rholeuAM6]|nr:MAG: hypothetical protein BZ135_09110 [Methanosphaera sp. rholeuAM6]
MLNNDEMKYRADNFIKKHKSDKSEKSQAQSYWKDFFDIFGVDANQVGEFEFLVVRESTGKPGFIDYYWRNQLIIEHKSLGKDLDKAFEQAIDYYNSLPKKHEKPRYIIVSDFKNIRLIDFKNDCHTEEIMIDQLREKIQLFKFIYSDGIKTTFKQEELNIKASEIIAQLHDVLEEDNYTGHYLEVFLIRIIFCLYAEDTGIFKPNLFYEYINRFNDEDLGEKIQKLFSILNTPENKRQNSLPEYLKAFPYVNGRLFEERIAPPNFTPKMKNSLINTCEFDWSEISPAIFGSIVQNTMDEQLRREFGAHFTSETNVKKVINSLFMDELWEEYNKNKSNPKKLEKLHDKIGRINVFDPACGSGNFLIVSYRELRLLEYEILKTLREEGQSSLTHYFASDITKIKIKNFYGIEIEEFPSKIAQVAMWIVEHQMNQKYKRKFNIDQADLPLKSSVNIYNENALQIDWKEILEPTDNVYILGNPPFVGKNLQTKEQKEEVKQVFKEYKNTGILDYVSCWYKKAVEYIIGTKIRVGFVSTNSIIQGEQAILLWKILLEDYKIHINFAHQSFKWGNEIKKKAGVFVVIIGFSQINKKQKYLFSYEKPDALPVKHEVTKINNYLVEYDNVILKTRRKPISDVEPIKFGSMPNDDGNLILSDEEKEEVLNQEPNLKQYIKPLISSKEFLNGKNRWCFWLENAKPSDLKASIILTERINNIKHFRLASTRKQTRQKAEYPTLFAEIRQPETDYIVIPLTTSENRDYIPLSFVDKDIISNNTVSLISSDDKYLFGILTSKMHMTWMRYVCGRLKGDYRYSNTLVYNNYPFPTDVKDDLKDKIRSKVDELLEIRDEYDDTLANLYDPLLMPPDLKKTHQQLDTLVDKCYQGKPFRNGEERMKLLFDLYSNYVES